MYECVPRKMTKSFWRSTKPVLPLYARRIEFDEQIRDFGKLFAACHAGTPPPPSPKLVRQNAEPVWHVIDPLQAMEEGLTPIETTVEIAPFKNYVALLLRAAQYDTDDVYRASEPDHESDEEMYA